MLYLLSILLFNELSKPTGLKISMKKRKIIQKMLTMLYNIISVNLWMEFCSVQIFRDTD